MWDGMWAPIGTCIVASVGMLAVCMMNLLYPPETGLPPLAKAAGRDLGAFNAVLHMLHVMHEWRAWLAYRLHSKPKDVAEAVFRRPLLALATLKRAGVSREDAQDAHAALVDAFSGTPGDASPLQIMQVLLDLMVDTKHFKHDAVSFVFSTRTELPKLPPAQASGPQEGGAMFWKTKPSPGPAPPLDTANNRVWECPIHRAASLQEALRATFQSKPLVSTAKYFIVHPSYPEPADSQSTLRIDKTIEVPASGATQMYMPKSIIWDVGGKYVNTTRVASMQNPPWHLYDTAGAVRILQDLTSAHTAIKELHAGAHPHPHLVLLERIDMISSAVDPKHNIRTQHVMNRPLLRIALADADASSRLGPGQNDAE